MLRGGSWNNNARNCRSAYRHRFNPGNRFYVFGFRLCCSALPYRLLRSSLRSADMDRANEERSVRASGAVEAAGFKTVIISRLHD